MVETETLVLLRSGDDAEDCSGTIGTEQPPKSSSSTPADRETVQLESDPEWDQFFQLQNDPSTNSTNPEPFSPIKGESHYHGKEIVGKVADQIKAEIAEGLLKSNNVIIGSVMIKEGKREKNLVYPTVRVVLHANGQGVDVAKLVSGACCQKYGIKTITFCHPSNQGTQRRGACCYVNEEGKRVYEIISGLWELTLNWTVEDDDAGCKIVINIDGKKGTTLIEGNGVTPEQLRANKGVKVGRRRGPTSLYEALASEFSSQL